jgi:putative ABC transport system ATP-binding protein
MPTQEAAFTYVQAKNITKSFQVGAQEIKVLKDISFEVKGGDFVIIFGPSGSGKSTLLHVLLGLEVPNSGNLTIMGTDIYSNRSEDDRAVLRKQLIGMVYQQPNWIKSLNVLENVAFPMLLLGREREHALQLAHDALTQVGMENWAHYKPTELSGGQQQRVALSRALINSPEIIIADEPTGNLDFQSGQEIMQLLHEMNSKINKTVIMVTHDLEYMKYARTIIRMLDGQILRTYAENEKDQLLEEVKFKRGVMEQNT